MLMPDLHSFNLLWTTNPQQTETMEFEREFVIARMKIRLSCHRRTHPRYVMCQAHMVYTTVDAECDKQATVIGRTKLTTRATIESTFRGHIFLKVHSLGQPEESIHFWRYTNSLPTQSRTRYHPDGDKTIGFIMPPSKPPTLFTNQWQREVCSHVLFEGAFLSQISPHFI